MWYNNFVINSKATPAIISDIFANRPLFASIGVLFISTDTLELYQFNGTGWSQLIGSNTGLNTIFLTGSGTGIITDSRLIGRSVKLILRGGIGSGQIITTGLPVNNEILYNSTLGTIQSIIDFDLNELITVQYE